MRARLVILLAAAACHRGADIPNHDPLSPEISGLERIGQGAYEPFATERFHLVYSGQTADVRWSASGGQLTESGDEVSWTLPGEGDATLTASLETKTRIATSTFRFRIAASGGLAMGAAPTGVIDGSGAATGNSCDLAFDSAGSPVIIYRNDTHPSIWLAKWGGSSWQTELVDGMGFETGGAVDYQMSLALAADGTPHIAYSYEDGSLRYATKSGGVWTRERADGNLARLSDHYSFLSIALDHSRSNRPTIFYREPNGYGYSNVIAATRSGTWTNTRLNAQTSTYGAWFYGGLAIDAAGVSYFSYYDANSSGPRVGAWAGNTADATVTSTPTTENTSISAAYQQPVPLSLDASGKPILMYSTALTHAKPGDAAITRSPFEESAVSPYDLTFGNGKPAMALVHGSTLELVTTDASGYWTYTNAGSADAVSGGRIGVAVDPAGALHACFRRSGVITYQ